MTYVLTITQHADLKSITGALVEQLREIVGGADIAELCPSTAYDIALTNRPDANQMAEISAICTPAKVDANVMATAGRRKKLLIADMDSTIIEQECIDELAEFAGKRAEISDITERAMRGELDFEGALTARVEMLKGLDEQVLETAFNERISLSPGAKTLVQTMNQLGAKTALVSGGFTYFTGRVSKLVGFQINRANTLIMNDGKMTGEVGRPILGRAAKEEALLEFVKEMGTDENAAIAVGDGANDLAMLGRAGVGVAYRAKPAVAEAAGVQINHSDLTALLYLQGIAADEHVSEHVSA